MTLFSDRSSSCHLSPVTCHPPRGTRGQGLLGLLALVLILAAVAWILGKEAAVAGPRILALTAGLFVALVTFVSPDAGFIILIFSMLLSPELAIGAVPQRQVVVRVDDILLALVFVTWWGRLALRRELGMLRKTPLNVPLVLFLVVCGLATVLGIVGGTVTSPKESLFYFLKYTEYFLLYVMFASQVRSPEQLRRFLAALLVTYVIVALYGYISMGAGASRVSAPFEGEKGEPNTMAGYLILMFSVIGGIALYTTSPRLRWLLAAAFALGIPPFLQTLSRGGYLAFVAAYLATVGFAKRPQRVGLVMALVVTGVAYSAIFPERVITRVTTTVSARPLVGSVRVGNRYLDTSASQRIRAWKSVVQQIKDRPLLGCGVTGVGLVDQQYALVLGEVGIVGMLVYLWTRWLLWVQGLRIMRQVQDPLYQGLTRGFLAGFAGLLIHSFAGNIFIIVRIMEPFWCLAAMVMVLPELTKSQAAVA